MLRRFAALLCLLGCSPAKQTTSPTAPEVAARPPKAAAPVVSATEDESSPKCDVPDVHFEPESVDLDLACFPRCTPDGVVGHVRIVNCIHSPVEVLRVGVSDGSDADDVTLRGDTQKTSIAPGAASVPLDVVVRRPVRSALFAKLASSETTSGSERKTFFITLPIRARDSKLEAEKSACEARGDYFGARGMIGRVQCWQVMKDADKPCSDARDCQGHCILDSEVVISPTEKRVSGHCSKFETDFGCAAHIGTTRNGIMSRKGHFVRVCRD